MKRMNKRNNENMSGSRKRQMEKKMADSLREGEPETADPQTAARKAVHPRYEIRMQLEHDPILEEIVRYRQIAKEADDRYDRYLARIPQHLRPGEDKPVPPAAQDETASAAKAKTALTAQEDHPSAAKAENDRSRGS
jgi:hypothetical protein